MGNYVGRQTRSESVGSLESFRRSISQSLMNKSNSSKPNASEPPVSKSRCSIEKIPYRVEHLLELGKADMETQVMHGWNPLDKSVNIFVKGDHLTLHRRPISQSTDSIRGKIGYRGGIHMWEIKWISNQRGTHACVGVATKKAPTRKAGYCSLIGNNEHSWGWDLGRNILRHAEEQVAPACMANHQENHNKLSYPPMDDTDTSYIVPSVFQCVLDMDAGTLGFMADGQWLGTAFSGLQGKTLYPVVSCVWGHCEVTMKYLNGLPSCPLGLKEFSRRAIRNALPETTSRQISQVPLPASLKRYIKDYGLKYYVRVRHLDHTGYNNHNEVHDLKEFETVETNYGSSYSYDEELSDEV